MNWLISRLIGFAWPAVAAVVAALGLWGGVQTFRLHHAQAATEEVKKAWQLDRAQATEAALKSEQTQRQREQAWQATVKEQQDAYNLLKAESAKKLARYSAESRANLADNDRLRGALAAYAARPSDGSEDTIAASNRRAAALGLLLAEALRAEDEALLVGAESTSAAESAGDSVRTLLNAWPK